MDETKYSKEQEQCRPEQAFRVRFKLQRTEDCFVPY